VVLNKTAEVLDVHVSVLLLAIGRHYACRGRESECSGFAEILYHNIVTVRDSLMPAASAQKKRPDQTTKSVQPAGFERTTHALLAEFKSRSRLRSGSLILTVFGDTVLPHGGRAWLGSLIEALAPFGISHRLVRTSVFRLVSENWLAREQVGRRSYYSLTAFGLSRFEEASTRIYGDVPREWNGEWSLAMLSSVASEYRDAIRKELRWQGFAPFSSNVYAHPWADPDKVAAELSVGEMASDAIESLILMRAKPAAKFSDPLTDLVRNAWSLNDLDIAYADFLDRFRPLASTLQRRKRAIDPASAFAARTLLIHEYRKLQLRDPLLPAELLPRRWNGNAASELCRKIYDRIGDTAAGYVVKNFQSVDGPLPAADSVFYRRFGGVTRVG